MLVLPVRCALGGGHETTGIHRPYWWRCGNVVARGARGQPTLPVVGFVGIASAKSWAAQSSAFLKGLNEAGYVDGRNVVVEFHWAEGRIDRLPAMMADLVHRQVAVIAATSTKGAI